MPVSRLDPDPVWAALGGLKRLLELLPETSGGVSRLDQCLTIVRGHSEQDLFPDGCPDAPSGDGVRLIQYPRIELNWLVEAARPAILSLLESVDLERATRERLRREVRKEEPFLEDDDRGTIGGLIEPTGMTKEKERNNTRLDALAAFLYALRRQPYAAVRYAVRELDKVAIPPEVLSADVTNSTVTFRSTAYPVSEEACHFIRLLVSARGGTVTSTDVSRSIPEAGTVRTDRLRLKLPKALKEAIETTPQGSKLLLDRLLSYP